MRDDLDIVPAFPKVINIETTNRCNLNCVICPRHDAMNRPVGDMMWTLFQRVIDEIAASSVPGSPPTIGLHLFGEPLLHPDLLRQIRYVKTVLPTSGLYLSTNVALLRGTLAEGLASSLLDWIVLSLDGATKETYERVRRGASFDTAVANVRGFLEMLERQGTDDMHVWVQLVAADEGLTGEVEQFYQTWGSWEKRLPRMRVVIKPATDWAGQVPITPVEGSDEKENIPRPGRCRRVVEQLNVYWNGEVTACCYDVGGLLKVGSVQEESLAAIWHGSQMTFLREVFRQGKQRRLPLCRTCEDAG